MTMECSCCPANNSGIFFEVNLSHQGTSHIVHASAATTGLQLHQLTLQSVFGVAGNDTDENDSSANEVLKLLFKGKRIPAVPDSLPFAGVSTTTTKMKPLKILVVATNTAAIQELATKRSDPTIRGFDQERQAIEKRKAAQTASQSHWADGMGQDKDFKFCRKVACTDHSFGHRSTERTPHAFKAMQLLEKMATDPGIVAIMKERELVVGTLGEMDPIDDRIMQKTEQKGGCLLGYNTNRGLRIDIKLRTDDLSDFRPYAELVGTLIHELSHNWVGEHNLLFWTNYAQMRAEYLYTHARLKNSAVVVRGKKTAELAGLSDGELENVFGSIMNELVREMGQHGFHPNMIADPIRQRIRELETEDEQRKSQQGQRLGGSLHSQLAAVGNGTTGTSARELALAAAERRAREQQKPRGKNGDKGRMQ